MRNAIIKILNYYKKSPSLSIAQPVDHASLLAYWGNDQLQESVQSKGKQSFRKKFMVWSYQTKKLSRKLVLITVPLCLIIAAVKLYTAKPITIHAAWFDDNYSYRQNITFTNSSEINAERRVTVTINTSTLITAGKMQSDCDDTRFTNANGKLLRYQLTGTCNNAATTYDVVFLSIVN